MKKTNKHLPIVLLAALTVVLAIGGWPNRPLPTRPSIRSAA